MARKPKGNEQREETNNGEAPETEPSEKPYKPGTGQFSEAVCGKLRRILVKKLRLKGQVDDLTKMRKDLESKLAEADQDSKAYREIMADWGIVEHKLAGCRAELNALSGQMDSVVKEADQHEFEFASSKAE